MKTVQIQTGRCANATWCCWWLLLPLKLYLELKIYRSLGLQQVGICIQTLASTCPFLPFSSFLLVTWVLLVWGHKRCPWVVFVPCLSTFDGRGQHLIKFMLLLVDESMSGWCPKTTKAWLSAKLHLWAQATNSTWHYVSKWCGVCAWNFSSEGCSSKPWAAIQQAIFCRAINNTRWQW